MKIYRFAPNLDGYAHPSRTIAGPWWPVSIDLGSWMNYTHDLSAHGCLGHRDGNYSAPSELPLSDFPWLSLQLPVMSERAARQLGCHPDQRTGWKDLAVRLRPIEINGAPFFVVQPLFEIRGERNAFVPEASVGVQLEGGEVVYYHTRMFEPDRLRGEFFTILGHQPISETYVTETFVERACNAALTGIADLELVFDDGPVSSRRAAPTDSPDKPSFRRSEEWSLFRERGAMWSYLDSDLQPVFDRAVADGLIPVSS
jgi:hypothetical protein